jgi:hypothetical protein
MQPDAPTRTISSYSPGWWLCASLVAELGRVRLDHDHKDSHFTPKSGSAGKAGTSRLPSSASALNQPNSSVIVQRSRGAAEPDYGCAGCAQARTAGRPALYLLLQPDLDVAALDVATAGVAVLGAPDSSMEKLSPVISPNELPGSPLSNTWTDELAPQRPERPGLRPVGALEQSSRLLAPAAC